MYLEIFLKKFFFKFQVPSTDFRVHSKRLNESNRRRVNSRTDSGFTLIARKRTFAHRLVDEIPVGGAFRKKYRRSHSLPTHEVFVRERAGESNRKSRCQDLENFSTFFRKPPPLCEQNRPGDDEIIDRWSPVLHNSST